MANSLDDFNARLRKQQKDALNETRRLENQEYERHTPIEYDVNAGRNSFERGLASGRESLSATWEGAKAAGNALAGDERALYKNLQRSQDFSQNAQRIGPEVNDIDKVDNIRDLGSFAAGAIGQAMPSISSMAASGGITGIAAKGLVKTLGKKALKEAEKKVTQRAAAGGAFGAGYTQMVGEQFSGLGNDENIRAGAEKIANQQDRERAFAGGNSGYVSRVYDGDTVEITQDDGTKRKLRLGNLNTADVGQEGKDEATRRLTDLVSGKRLFFNTGDRSYDRDVATLYSEDLEDSVNNQMLKVGAGGIDDRYHARDYQYGLSREGRGIEGALPQYSDHTATAPMSAERLDQHDSRADRVGDPAVSQTGESLSWKQLAGLALTGSIPAAALDVLPVTRVLKKFGLGGEASVGKLYSRIAKETMKGASSEGATEAGQQGIQRAVAAFADENKEILGEEGLHELRNAAAMGFFGGAPFGALGGIPGKPNSGTTENPKDDIDTKAEKDTEAAYKQAAKELAEENPEIKSMYLSEDVPDETDLGDFDEFQAAEEGGLNPYENGYQEFDLQTGEPIVDQRPVKTAEEVATSSSDETLLDDTIGRAGLSSDGNSILSKYDFSRREFTESSAEKAVRTALGKTETDDAKQNLINNLVKLADSTKKAIKNNPDVSAAELLNDLQPAVKNFITKGALGKPASEITQNEVVSALDTMVRYVSEVNTSKKLSKLGDRVEQIANQRFNSEQERQGFIQTVKDELLSRKTTRKGGSVDEQSPYFFADDEFKGDAKQFLNLFDVAEGSQLDIVDRTTPASLEADFSIEALTTPVEVKGKKYRTLENKAKKGATVPISLWGKNYHLNLMSLQKKSDLGQSKSEESIGKLSDRFVDSFAALLDQNDITITTAIETDKTSQEALSFRPVSELLNSDKYDDVVVGYTFGKRKVLLGDVKKHISKTTKSDLSTLVERAKKIYDEGSLDQQYANLPADAPRPSKLEKLLAGRDKALDKLYEDFFNEVNKSYEDFGEQTAGFSEGKNAPQPMTPITQSEEIRSNKIESRRSDKFTKPLETPVGDEHTELRKAKGDFRHSSPYAELNTLQNKRSTLFKIASKIKKNRYNKTNFNKVIYDANKALKELGLPQFVDFDTQQKQAKDKLVKLEKQLVQLETHLNNMRGRYKSVKEGPEKWGYEKSRLTSTKEETLPLIAKTGESITKNINNVKQQIEGLRAYIKKGRAQVALESIQTLIDGVQTDLKNTKTTRQPEQVGKFDTRYEAAKNRQRAKTKQEKKQKAESSEKEKLKQELKPEKAVNLNKKKAETPHRITKESQRYNDTVVYKEKAALKDWINGVFERAGIKSMYADKIPDEPSQRQQRSRLTKIATEWLARLQVAKPVSVISEKEAISYLKAKIKAAKVKNEPNSPKTDQGPLTEDEKVLDRIERGVQLGFVTPDGKIYINPRLKPEQQTQVLAHEIGHMVKDEHYNNADAKTKAALEKAWQEHLDRNAGSISEALKQQKPPTVADLFRNEDRAISEVDQEYQLSFDEWMADNIGRWLTSNEKATSVVDKFYVKVAKALRKLYNLLPKQHFKANKSVAAFVNDLWLSTESVDASAENVAAHVDEAFLLDTDQQLEQKILAAMMDVFKSNLDPKQLKDAREYIRTTLLVSQELTNGNPQAEELAFRVAYAVMLTDDQRRILDRALNATHVKNQLIRKVGDKYAGIIRENNEAAMGYAYSLWVRGEITLGPKSESVFQDLLNKAAKVMGVVRDHEQAENLIQQMRDGTEAIANRTSEFRQLRVPAQLQDTKIRKMAALLREFSKGSVGKTFSKLISSASTQMQNTKNSALMHLDRMFFNSSHDDLIGSPESMHASRERINAHYKARVDRISHGKDSEFLTEVLHGLHRKQRSVNKEVAKAQVEVRKLMDDMYDYLKEQGVHVGHRGEYFPWVFNFDTMMDRKADFIGILAQEKYDPYISGKWEKNKKTGKMELVKGKGFDNEADRLAAAEKFYDAIMLNAGDADHIAELDMSRDTHTPFFASHDERILSFLEDDIDQLADFFEQDITSTMYRYIDQSVKRGEFAKRFGTHGYKLQNLLDEARRLGATEEEIERAKIYVQAMMGTLGADINPKLLQAQGVVMVYQNLRTLAFATLSSLIDPIGIAVRSGDLRLAAKSYASGLRSIAAKLTGKEHKIEAESVAELVGAIEMKGTLDSLAYEYGGTFTQGAAKKVNEAFFKYSGLTGFTRWTRVMATEGALQFIKFHTQHGNKHSQRYLDQLNLKKSDVRLDKDGRVKIMSAEEHQALVDERNAIVREKRRGEGKREYDANSYHAYLNEHVSENGKFRKPSPQEVHERVMAMDWPQVQDKVLDQQIKLKNDKANEAFDILADKNADMDSRAYKRADAMLPLVERELEMLKNERKARDLDAKARDAKLQELSAKLESDDRLKTAINRFVDESILRPNAAQRPMWGSDPHYMLIFHLKSFTYSMYERIIKRSWNEAVAHGNYTPLAMMTMYVPVMIAADMLRAGIKGEDEDEDKDAMDYLLNGVERAGLLGLGSFAVSAGGDVQRDNLPGSSLLGPTAEQILGLFEAWLNAKHGDMSYQAAKALPLQNVIIPVTDNYIMD